MSKEKIPTFEEWVRLVDRRSIEVTRIDAAEISDYSLTEMKRIYDDGVKNGYSSRGLSNMWSPDEFVMYFVEKWGLDSNTFGFDVDNSEVKGIKAWEE